MSGPYAEHSIVMEMETGADEPCLRIEPNDLPGDRWLHRREEFDRATSRETIVDRYALPAADEYEVALVTVPPGEHVQIGDRAGSDDCAGGGNLFELLDRDSVPADWIDETTTLEAFLDQ